MIDDVQRYIQEHRMVGRGQRLLAAVSGGRDSMTMLHLLARMRSVLGFELCCACVDHGIRDDTAEEIALVRSFAGDLDVPFSELTGDAPGVLDRNGGGLEQAAREVRLGLLAGEARKREAHGVALAHTLDDQAETVIMRIQRGTGLSGLGAMRPIRDGFWIRPLLQTARSSVAAYASRHRVPWIQDPTNRDPGFTRNRIRLEVLPVMEQIQPGIAERLAKLAHEAQDAGDVLAPLVNSAVKEAALSWEGTWILDRVVLDSMDRSLASLVVREVLRRLLGDLRGMGRSHVRSVMSLARSGCGSRRVDLPRGVKVVRAYDEVIFWRPRQGRCQAPERIRVEGPGEFSLGPLSVHVHPMRAGAPDPWPLLLRTRAPGDRLAGRGRKLKKLFIDRKVPAHLRDQVPVLTAGDQVLWVGGLYVDRDCGLEASLMAREASAYFRWLECRRR